MRKNSSSTETPDPLIDAFIDSVWLEDGLSALTLAAYRRDLGALALWLHTQDRSLATAGEPDLQAYFAHRNQLLIAAETSNPRLKQIDM